VQAKAKGATVWQHRNRAKATLWKSGKSNTVFEQLEAV
jgi:hypothetical protein